MIKKTIMHHSQVRGSSGMHAWLVKHLEINYEAKNKNKTITSKDTEQIG